MFETQSGGERWDSPTQRDFMTTTHFSYHGGKHLVKTLVEMQPASTFVKPECVMESNEEILLLARPQLLVLGYRWQEKQNRPGCQKNWELCICHVPLVLPRKVKLRACQCLIRPPVEELVSPGSPRLRIAAWGAGGQAAPHPPTNPSSRSATGCLLPLSQLLWLHSLAVVLPGTGTALPSLTSLLGLVCPDSTEREKEQKSKKAIPLEKQTGSELFSHTNSSFGCLNRVSRIEWDVNLGQSRARTVDPSIPSLAPCMGHQSLGFRCLHNTNTICLDCPSSTTRKGILEKILPHD